jgi:uncharacterized protein (TIGR03083 family)
MPDANDWISALRSSHDRFTAVVEPLDDAQVEGPSYDSEWTIAQVASHLGSGAEIFGLILDAGLAGADAPGGDKFSPVWDEWNARTPVAQVRDSVVVNDAFVTRLEQLSDSDRSSFAMSLFGSDLDLAGLAAMRLGEHAVHTLDVEVALDPEALVAPTAVALLIDRLGATAGRTAKSDGEGRVVIATSEPERTFVLELGPDVTLAPGAGSATVDLNVPAEAFLRLVYGRLDAEHAPDEIADDDVIVKLRKVFPGF